MKKVKATPAKNALNFIILNKKQYPELEQAHKILLTQNATVECLEVTDKVEKVKKSAIYIIGEFSGNLFDQLKKTAKIIGGHCVITAFHENLSIPKSSNPVFSLTLQRKVVTSTGLTPAERARVKERVSWMGGLFVNALTDSVTRLLGDGVGSKKYKIARKLKLEVMLPTWVDHLWETQSLQSVEEFHCPSLKGLVVSLSGFSAADRAALKKIVEKNGGEYSPNVRVAHCTHLVVPVDPVLSDKLRTAKKNNIYIVTPTWLYESDKSPYCADETPHRWEVASFSEIASLNPDETQDIPSFSQIADLNISNRGILSHIRIYITGSLPTEVGNMLDMMGANIVDDISMATHVFVDNRSEMAGDYSGHAVLVDAEWVAECASSGNVETGNREGQIDSFSNIINSQCSTILQNDILSQYEGRIFDGLTFGLHSNIDNFTDFISEQIQNYGGTISPNCDYLVSRIIIPDGDYSGCANIVTDIWIKCSIRTKELLGFDCRYFRPIRLKNRLLLESLVFDIATDGTEDDVIPSQIKAEALSLLIESHNGLVLRHLSAQSDWQTSTEQTQNITIDRTNHRHKVFVCNSDPVLCKFDKFAVVSYDWVFNIIDKGSFDPDLDLPCMTSLEIDENINNLSENRDFSIPNCYLSSTPSVHMGRVHKGKDHGQLIAMDGGEDCPRANVEHSPSLPKTLPDKPKFRLSDAFEMCRSINESGSWASKSDSSLNLSTRFTAALTAAVKNIEGGILEGVVCYFGVQDCQNIKNTLLSLGGEVSGSLDQIVTHLIANLNYTCYENINPGMFVVSPDWLLQCKHHNKRVSETLFAVSIRNEPLINQFADLLAEEAKKRPVEVSLSTPSLVQSSVSNPTSHQISSSFEVKLRDEFAENELKRLSSSKDGKIDCDSDHFESLMLDDSGTFIGNISELDRAIAKKCIFIFSSMASNEKEFCRNVLKSLGGQVVESANYVEECTHLIAGSLSRNEKTLSCIAAGKWVLRISFVYACHASSFFIDEIPHQWENLVDKLSPTQQRLADSIRHWRRYIKSHSRRAFDGWVCDVQVKSESKRGSFERLLLAGGGVLSKVSNKPPTHVFADERSVVDGSGLYLQRITPRL